MKPVFSALAHRLFAPTDSASVVLFRVAFGAILFWECTRYFSHNWIERYWIRPVFYFTYPGFQWVKPLDGYGMYIHFAVLAIAALFVLLGLFYRISAAVIFLGFSYIFLIDQATYLNHFYFLCLLAFWMMMIPAHRTWSLDARFSRVVRSETVPRWSVWMLRFQVGVLYFYGGVAKINRDWLIHAEPLRTWLSYRTDFPLIGPWFTQPWMPYLFAWSGLLIDLCCVPLLLWRRTRLAALLVLVSFHLMNSLLFEIGIFPWFAMAVTTIFLDPDWCRPLLNKLDFWNQKKDKGIQASKPVTAARPARAKQQMQHIPQPPVLPTESPDIARSGRLSPARVLLIAVLLIWGLWQLCFPLRHYLYEGDVNWTEEGHRFSWHMKLRDKEAQVSVMVKDPQSGEAWFEPVKNHLTRRQQEKMSGHPDMILQFAHYLAWHFRQKGRPQVEVYAQSAVSLNGRPPQWMIDTSINLAAQPRLQFRPYSWVLPLPDSVVPRKVASKGAVSEESD